MPEDSIKRIINNILGPHPKKEINVKNNRTKKWPKKSDSCKSSGFDAEQGMVTESNRKED